MFQIRTEHLHHDTARWRVANASGNLASVSRILDLFATDTAFVDSWSSAMRNHACPAFCWECPPLRSGTLDQPFECVLVDSPMLRQARPDPKPFAEHFAPRDDVVVFPSLGKDAMLVAPCPRPGGDYAHLASFLRTAPEAQVRGLWRTIGQHAASAVAERPLWLSTAGLGVSWLHVRFDTQPKYYRHAAYRSRE